MTTLKELQARVQAISARKRVTAPPSPPPPYDEVYALGTAWLDSLAEGDLESAEVLLNQPQPRALAEHLLCRPPASAVDVLRLGLDGEWGPDDGRPALAFSYRILTGLAGGPPMASAVRCHCGGSGCPGTLAMAKTRERWGSANGRSEPPVFESTP